MPKIENAIERARDHRDQERVQEKITGIMVHRCGVDLETGVILGYDGPTVSDAFTGRALEWAEVARATGGQNAYSIMIGGDLGPAEFDGQIWQLLDLDEIGWHGRRFSKGYVGVAVIGDFRAVVGKPLSQSQFDAMIWFVSGLCASLGLPASSVVGHGEVKGAHGGSKAPGMPAACPGDHVDMEHVRRLVESSIALASQGAARQALISAGFAFP